MATITVTIGAVSSTKNAANATAQTIIADYIAAQNGPTTGTNQEQLDWFLTNLMGQVRAVANGYRRRVLQEQAAANESLDSRGWT